MKLLIVEDNDQMRRLIKSMVSDIAESVIECADGVEALAAYSKHRPDWVLMDIRMGCVDGVAATRLIKAAFPSAKIMIVSDYDDARLRKAARCAGARGYILKEDLLALREVLTTQGREEEGEGHERTTYLGL